MPKYKDAASLQRKRKTAAPKPSRTAPIPLTQEHVDGLRAADRKVRKEVSRSLAAAVPSGAPADENEPLEGPHARPLPVKAAEMKKIRKARRLPREIVARLLERKPVDPPRTNPPRQHEEPGRKPQK